jgi:hypothetical protein
MKKITMISAFMLMLLSAKGTAQNVVTVIDPATVGGFETADTFEGNGWAVQNATYGSRKWQIGTGQTGYTGERAAFIGSSATTVGTAAGSRTVHLYRPVLLPANATNIQLSFKYKQEVVAINAETGPNDYLYLSIVDDAPVAGNTATASQFGGKFPSTAGIPNFTPFAVEVPTEKLATATQKYLVFTFRSTNLSDPATIGWGAIDDIKLTYSVPCTVTAPTAAAQSFCNAATVGELKTTTGTNVVWYNVATEGTALTAATALATGTYYVAQVDGTCESTRVAVAVTLNKVAAPMGNAAQEVKVTGTNAPTLADLAVTLSTGGTISWYASAATATAGTPALPLTTPLVSGTTYYATQTVGTCTSIASLAVTATVTTLGTSQFAIAGFSYYPNPVNDVLTLTAQQDITAVTITNLLGQQVINQTVQSHNATINTAALTQGTYLVTVTAGANSTTVKIVK